MREEREREREGGKEEGGRKEINQTQYKCSNNVTTSCKTQYTHLLSTTIGEVKLSNCDWRDREIPVFSQTQQLYVMKFAKRPRREPLKHKLKVSRHTL